jgi:hypothetical protein
MGSVAVLATTAGLALPAPAAGKGADRGVEFRTVRSDAERFIDYSNSIRLTQAQERIKAEALEAIPAPCCSEYTMATCCCPCNLAKSAWGLSNYLIAKKGSSAGEVRVAVQRWLKFVNPSGFSGDVCSKGGCNRPFGKNGCGGMDQTRVIVGDDMM